MSEIKRYTTSRHRGLVGNDVKWGFRLTLARSRNQNNKNNARKMATFAGCAYVSNKIGMLEGKVGRGIVCHWWHQDALKL